MKRSEMSEDQKKRSDLLCKAYEKLNQLYTENPPETLYQGYMARHDLLVSMALICHNAQEFSLATFLNNAAIGFEIRAKKLLEGMVA